MRSDVQCSYRAGGRLAVVILAGALCVLALFVAPALAAAPETPETVSPAKSVTATTATLEGVLNPGASGAPGSYQFSYVPSEADECTPGTLDPEAPALANGALKEKESVSLTGLEPNREYAFCIIAYSLSAEASQGAAVSFKTLTEKPSVASEKATVSSTTATLEAQVNPNNQETTFLFEYATKTKAGALEGAITVEPEGPSALSGFGDQTATVPQIKGLTPGKSYFYRVVATNATGTIHGAIEEVATTATPHTEAATVVTATTATFHGTLSPLNATVSAKYSFEYNVGTEPVCTGESATAVASAGTGSGSKAVSSAVSELQPSATYWVCLVSSNAFGSEADSTPVTFHTLAAPPKIDGESTADVTPFEATLEAQLNPNNQETSYHFEYATNPGLSGAVTLAGAGPLSGYGDQAAGVATGHVLAPGTTYYYRLIAENTAHEKAEGAVEEFSVPVATPPVIESETYGGIATEDATLEAIVDPDYQETTCEFEYAASETAIGTAGAVALPCSAPLGSGGPGVATSIALSGLTPNTLYYFRLVATNETGPEVGKIETFETSTAFAPAITEESVSGVEATTAKLEAEINPEGAATTYDFQYGPGEAYEKSTAVIPLPVSGKASATLTGLEPGETYHYRVVAFSSQSPGGTLGKAKVFTTAEAASTTAETCANAQLRAEQSFGQDLPDCRAYEVVSPLQTYGQDATEPFVGSRPRASLTGNAITYTSRGSFEEPAGATVENQYLSRREADGWTTRAITPLRNPTKGESAPSYPATVFTSELSAGIAATNDSLTGPGAAGEFRLYLANLENGTYQFVADEPANYPYPMGASSDLSHVVYGVNGEIYEWVNGAVTPVNLTNTDEQPMAAVGAVPHYHGREDVSHAVSANGSRVYFSTPGQEEEAGTRGIYVRVNAEQPHQSALGAKGECLELTQACTLEVSAGAAQYWGASADGSKAFFTEGEDLYEYSLPIGQVSGGQRTAITTGGKVQGVVQIAEDGSYVYFVAKSVLTGGEENQHHETAQNEEDNLYMYTGGHVTFIATLAEGDEAVWQFAANTGESGPETNAAVVNPSGTRLAFLSEKSLTGYDNEQATPGACGLEKDNLNPRHGNEGGLCNELYLYDAQAGTLVCASCDPTGARPSGPASLGPIADSKSYAEYRPRNLLEDGTLFFDSLDALVPHAAAGVQSVYEFENGHIHAISDPTGEHESFFLDASAKGPNPEEAEGSNVFFATADKLLPQEQSENVVVYDARVDGGFQAPNSTSTCAGETCKPVASLQPPLFSAPSSQTFSGPGNIVTPPATTVTPVTKTAAQVRAEKLAKALKACRKDKRKKKRQACERLARTKYGAKKAKKASRAEKAARASLDGRVSR